MAGGVARPGPGRSWPGQRCGPAEELDLAALAGGTAPRRSSPSWPNTPHAVSVAHASAKFSHRSCFSSGAESTAASSSTAPGRRLRLCRRFVTLAVDSQALY
jgi:hypothetical protein